jgi:hypothetical protein
MRAAGGRFEDGRSPAFKSPVFKFPGGCTTPALYNCAVQLYSCSPYGRMAYTIMPAANRRAAVQR